MGWYDPGRARCTCKFSFHVFIGRGFLSYLELSKFLVRGDLAANSSMLAMLWHELELRRKGLVEINSERAGIIL